ncbi:hypothetical protein CFELI_12815 [Corynebacterium felinum]|uniref:Uncharacterized protein n=1 Tax=Corynebacterium felinum TaxID=131318 RepID=A0ABU2B7G5_9CORY|nr:hypothetical protein [Corynebacterium felinum]WJY96142.1 hypothetical protein CFELI_12815 [Corynebacterium felinum]
MAGVHRIIILERNVVITFKFSLILHNTLGTAFIGSFPTLHDSQDSHF